MSSSFSQFLKDTLCRWRNDVAQLLRNFGDCCLGRDNAHSVANAASNKRWRQTEKFEAFGKRLVQPGGAAIQGRSSQQAWHSLQADLGGRDFLFQFSSQQDAPQY